MRAPIIFGNIPYAKSGIGRRGEDSEGESFLRVSTGSALVFVKNTLSKNPQSIALALNHLEPQDVIV